MDYVIPVAGPSGRAADKAQRDHAAAVREAKRKGNAIPRTQQEELIFQVRQTNRLLWHMMSPELQGTFKREV
jgi:hypothetical protein